MPVLYRYTFLLIFQALLLTFVVSESRAQWVKLSEFNDGTFYNEVYFYDQNLGFVTSFGGSVLRTANGGTSWSTVTLPNAAGSSNRDVCFVSTSVGFVSGEDGVWKSTDGGLNWTDVTPAGASNIGSSSCWFRDANIGIWGYGGCLDSTVTFWSTTDGGATWSSITYTHSTPDVAVGGATYSNGTFYAAGGSGKFWKSTDDGANWTLSNTNSNGWQEDLNSTGGALYIASANGTSCNLAAGGGKVLVSFDGGSNWTTSSFPGTVMWGVSMYSASNGWAVGDQGDAYKTTDGGVSWTESSCGLRETDRLDDVWMINATNGFAVGDGIYRFATDVFVAEPDTIDFGNVIIGSVRGDSIAQVRAIGTTGTVSARAILGTDATEFVAASNITNPQQIPECGVARTLLRFAPTTVGPKTARLEFTVTGVGTPLVVYLKGNGVRPDVVGPIEHKFDTLLCENEKLDTIVFSNVGDYRLRIDSSFIANNVGIFTLVSPKLPIILQPFENQEFIIRGRATITGMMRARMYLYMDDPEFSDSAWVTDLLMYKRRIEAKINPDTLVRIPSRPVDSTSTICVTYVNTGDGTQTVEQLAAISSSDPTIRSTFVDPVELQPGDSTTICFTATATDTLGRCRRFRVLTQPCGIETFLTVCYQAAEGRLDVPTVRNLAAGCGETSFDTVTAYNTGNDSALVIDGLIRGTDADRFALIKPDTWPLTIPAGDSITLIVSFTPGDRTEYTGELALRLENGSETVLELKGNRDAPEIDISEKMNDIGRLCPDEVREVIIQLANVGKQGTMVTSVTPLDNDARITTGYVPTTPLSPASVDSIVLIVTGSEAGPFSARFEVLYDSDCLPPDTITVIGTVLERSLSITPDALDFGIVPVGRTGSARAVIRNTSDTAITLNLNDPALTGVSITHPSGTVELKPGDTLEVTLQFKPEEELQVDGILEIEGSGRCLENYDIPVKGKSISRKVYVSGNIDFGIIPCDQMPTDSLYVFNQNDEDIQITAASFTNADGFVLELPGSVPLTIPANDSVRIRISVTSGLVGQSSTELVLLISGGSDPELRATIRAERREARSQFVEENGTILTSFELPLFSRCLEMLDTTLLLKNSGNVHDTVDITSSVPANLVITSPLPIILAPGEQKEVQIRITMTSRGQTPAVLRAMSRVCPDDVIAMTELTYVDVTDALSGPDLDFRVICLGKDHSLELKLENSASYPVSISRMFTTDDAFTPDDTSPFVLASTTARTLKIRFTPTDEVPYTGELVVVTDAPCNDTLRIPLSGSGVKCLLPDIVLHPANTIGRWGTTQSIPVIVDGTNLDVAGTIELRVKAAATLLHPEGVRIAEKFAGKWDVVSQNYDPAEETLSLVLSGPGAGGETAGTVNNGDTLFFIDYRVLRGDRISTPVELIADSLLPGGLLNVGAGEFLLEDYCDAHGRLLRVTGNIALRTSVPNPARDRATVEYELPFSDHATLILFDETGSEVLRILDEVVPAGRRHSAIDVSELPSGTYTLQLRIGLQTLTQRMIVTQ